MSQHTTSSRYHRYGKCGSLLSPLALAICLAVPAQAQVLEEVIVTAQKKSESLQDAPIAISAFTSERLEQMGTSTAADIGNFTPNAVIAPSFGSSNNIRATIRGVGTAEPSLAIDPKVGIYLDGVYIARNAGAIFDIVDLERVEVLRGPQGTLWGKNTTGGAVNLVTSKPAEEFGFKQQLSAGDFGYFKSVTTVDTGRHGDVSARVSYMRRETDGWAINYNPQSEKDLGSEDVEAVKFSVRWDVTDNFAIDYGYDQTNSSAVAMPVQVASVNSFAAANPAINTIALRPFAAPAFYDVGNVFTQMAALANNHDRLDKFYMDGTLPEHVDIKGHNLTMTWNVGDVELRSISAYREYDSKGLGLDLDGGTYTGTLFNNPLYGFQSSNVKSSQQASQEFQMLGELLDGDLDYVVGLYYFEEDGREDNPWIISFWVPTFGPSNIQNIGTWGNWFEMESQSQAIYGQFTYDFTDRLALTVGMRYTEDEKSLVISQRDPGILFDQKDSEDWDKFTGAVTLAYALTDDINVYGKVSEGYSAGVYNPGSLNRAGFPTDASRALIPADPEETTSYEIGMKSELWDRRIRLNVAAFYNDSENLQVTDFQNGTRVTINSGEAEASGVEIDAVALLGAGWSINAAYGYLHQEFDSTVALNQVAPHNTATLGIQYDTPEKDWGQLSFRVDASYQDDILFSATDTTVGQDARTLLNGRITLSQIPVGEGDLKAAVWGRNLTDEEYRVHGTNFGFYTSYLWGEPRTFGVDVTYEF